MELYLNNSKQKFGFITIIFRRRLNIACDFVQPKTKKLVKTIKESAHTKSTLSVAIITAVFMTSSFTGKCLIEVLEQNS